MKNVTNMNKTFEEFFTEKYVVGLVEPVYIDGLGILEAKIDSGNGGYNVLHGEDIVIQGSKVTFKTVEGRRLMKPVVDTIKINVGAGHQEDRPVVLFDIKMGDREFHNVKFSIGNRSVNDHKVLISKGFIEGDLDALIDVSATNIVDRNVQVDYKSAPSHL